MDNDLAPQVLNFLALFSFIGLSLAIFGRLSYRYFLYRESATETPVLLKRDLALFSGITAFVILILIARVAGITNLSTNLLWILLSNALVQGPLSYWAYVEYKKN